MCAAPNLTGTFGYWHPADTHTTPTSSITDSASLSCYGPPSILQDASKLKSVRRPMFLVNNKHAQDVFTNNTCEKGCPCEPIPITFGEKEGKHFMTPLANQNQMSSHSPQSPPESKPQAQSVATPAKIRPYSCLECGKSFLLKHHLTTHTRVHSGERPHVCIHCGKTFAHKHCLNTHLLLHSSQRPYQCPECKKSFTLKHHLLTHSRVHSRERPFICTECGRTFPLKRHLVTHSKFHAGERPFVCEDCGESFAQKDHLVMHSRFHGSLNPFVCPDCGATFTRKFELVNHGRLHGRLPHSCPVCNKEFLQKRTLVAHMRFHSGDQPFSCVQCDRPLSCRECGSAFNSPEALALHVRLHSGGFSLNVPQANSSGTSQSQQSQLTVAILLTYRFGCIYRLTCKILSGPHN
ncbi:combgap [Carabus blaptoides fortunei]